jgi:N-acetylmuramoyl-L-alanine amidase
LELRPRRNRFGEWHGDRSQHCGHFAPTFPLQVGVNQFDLRYGKQTVKLTVTRLAAASEPPQGLAFGTLSPAVDVARLAE